jgi:hypothetical protein
MATGTQIDLKGIGCRQYEHVVLCDGIARSSFPVEGFIARF